MHNVLGAFVHLVPMELVLPPAGVSGRRASNAVPWSSLNTRHSHIQRLQSASED